MIFVTARQVSPVFVMSKSYVIESPALTMLSVPASTVAVLTGDRFHGERLMRFHGNQNKIEDIRVLVDAHKDREYRILNIKTVSGRSISACAWVGCQKE